MRIFIVFLTLLLSFPAFSDEGMWIPLLLEKYTIADMQKKGFKLSAEDIYSINKASMKDAVMIFGGGCTAELISDKGLLITNHHCGYSAIQSQSSVEHDYLAEGFWAKSPAEEIHIPDLSVTFLVYMEDVTSRVLSSVNASMNELARQSKINFEIEKIKKAESKDNLYKVEIKPFYYGNEYYMFVYQVYNDVRLVGAPPSSIGKFGGDTDNWIWPRHTGDFSLFRIYAGKDNQPAKYSSANIPYKPKKYFNISLKGYRNDDFTMVLGYPGNTSEYLTSFAVKIMTLEQNPFVIKLRGKRLEIMEEFMSRDNKVRIQYSSKSANIENAWKKWIGEDKGLLASDAIAKKAETEAKFQNWCDENIDRKSKYGHLLNEFRDVYSRYSHAFLALNFIYESLYAIEIVKFASKFNELVNINPSDTARIRKTINGFNNIIASFYKDYYINIDKSVFPAMFWMYYNNVDKSYYPDIFGFIKRKFKNDFNGYADYVFSNSMFSDRNKLELFLKSYNRRSVKKLLNDPVFIISSSISELMRNKLYDDYNFMNLKLDSLNRIYITGLQQMQKDKIFYPDANFTMRVSYGTVGGYSPGDGINYDYFTSLEGVIEKDNPGIMDYRVPPRLKELYLKKDYGKYSEDGEMHVCFIAKNHTSGGNSGSPVINAEGKLIGINFDRNWEGTMSDIMYNPEICRNIALDIRYVLFIIDKYAGASNLINEMSIDD